MLKYFIAIEPLRDQRVRIATVMRQMGDPWPVPHITVKAPDGLTSDLAWLPRVREVAARSARFIVTIGEARTFGNRILYLSVEGTNLAQLHQSILEVISPNSDLEPTFSKEREYVPHLTLAIAHKENALPPYEQLVSTLQKLDPFEVVELTIYRREDPATHYRVWKRLPLANSPEA